MSQNGKKKSKLEYIEFNPQYTNFPVKICPISPWKTPLIRAEKPFSRTELTESVSVFVSDSALSDWLIGFSKAVYEEDKLNEEIKQMTSTKQVPYYICNGNVYWQM